MHAPPAIGPRQRSARAWQAVWRWHFYAGLFSLPFIAILSLSGLVYVLKPQIEAFEERALIDLPMAGPPVSADAQLGAALAAHPRATFHAYRVPERPNDAARVDILDGERRFQVFVAPDAPRVLATFDADRRPVAIARDLHGTLLIKPFGGYIVELAGAWAFVLVATGLYLHWPRTTRRVAGLIAPRLGARGRPLWRDLHAVTGLWIAPLLLALLLTALPWTTIWADGFKAVRAEMGWADQRPADWRGGRIAHADHAAMPAGGHWEHALVPLEAAVRLARAERLAGPVMITPPDARMRWRIASDTANRPQRASLTLDAMTGAVVARERFADKHPLDRAISIGVAWHEGALFGWVNQLIGLVTALALLLMCVAAATLWWWRRPAGGLGAPPAPAGALGWGFAALLGAAGLLLPLLGISLLLIAVAEAAIRLARRAAA